MGADFIFTTLPSCVLTPERRQRALEHIAIADRINDHPDLEEMRAAAVEAIEAYPGMGDNREVARLWLDGAAFGVLITGGMTSGDAPTESFEQFEHINNCNGLPELLVQWAKEDK